MSARQAISHLVSTVAALGKINTLQ